MVGPWISCSKCGAISSVHRLGDIGVPPKMWGKRERTKDSKLFKCDSCGSRFKSAGVTIMESMGRDPREEVPY